MVSADDELRLSATGPPPQEITQWREKHACLPLNATWSVDTSFVRQSVRANCRGQCVISGGLVPAG